MQALARRVLDAWQSDELQGRLLKTAPAQAPSPPQEPEPEQQNMEYIPNVQRIAFSGACIKKGTLEFQRPGSGTNAHGASVF